MNIPITSGEAELAWAGDGSRYIPGVPADDLSAHDLDRLVYRASCGKREGTTDGLRPGDEGFDEARSALIADLLRDGLYRDARPAPPPPAPAKARPAPAPAPSGTED